MSLHGLRWEHPRGTCDRMLFLNGISFAWFCCEPGGNNDPPRFFMLNCHEGLIETPPSVRATKRIANRIAHRWRRRFRYWNWRDEDHG